MIFAPYEKTPIEAADDVKDFIKNKVVYDLGSGDGTFALALKQYAKEVVGVELDPILATRAVSRGVNTLNENFLDVDISKAEVLFVFMSFYGTSRLTKRLLQMKWKGLVISHYYPLHTMLDCPLVPIDRKDKTCPLLIYEMK